MQSNDLLPTSPDWFIPMRKGDISITRRNLPHWEQDGGTYFVTFRQADSVPLDVMKQWATLREAWHKGHPQPWDSQTTAEFHRRFTVRMEQYLDVGYGSCILKDTNARQIVTEALLHFNGKRYHMDCFTVMPNHVHAMFSTIRPYTLSNLLHSWKSYTSQLICKDFDLKAPFWMDERFDHLVRNRYYFAKYRRYIASNPEKAGLPNGTYSLWPEE